MSSLSRNVLPRRASLILLVVAGALATGAAQSAADAYFIPMLETSAETHDNLNLRPSESEGGSQTGYTGVLGAILGLRSPTGQTEVRPRYVFQKFSDRDELAQNNAYLDITSAYRTTRSRFSFLGRYSLQNEYSAEISQAQFDETEGGTTEVPPEDSTGRLVFADSKITRILLIPDYSFQLSQRTGIGARALYQTANYDGGLVTNRDYDFGQLTGYLSWELSQRARLETGLYTTKYKTDDGENETKSNGVSLDLQYVWTPTFVGIASVKVEDTDVSRTGVQDESSKNYGFELGVRKKGEISNIEARVGRMFSPSFGGVRVIRDEVRAQYTRSLSQLWSASAAVRAYRNKSQGELDDNDRKFARLDLEVNRQLSRTWYVSAGYSYLWQEYYVDNDAGKDNVFMLTVGYQGMGPPKR